MNAPQVHTVLKWLLGLSLVATGLLKFTGGEAESFLPQWVEAAIGVLEVLFGVLLLRGHVMLAGGFAATLAAAGAMAVFLAPKGASCGCLGRSVPIDDATHLLLASSLGVLACAVVLTRPGEVPAADPRRTLAGSR